MSREEFDQLVRRLEEKAKRNPGGYVRRTAAMVFMGYAYLFTVLTLSVLFLALLVLLVVVVPNAATIKIAIVLGLLFGGICLSILKGLWVKLPPPDGLRIQKDEAPELFALLEEISVQLNSQKFHEVILTGEFNAAVVQSPRLGIFGWQRNYLIVGMPLLLGLTRDEFASVMAHEFGHLSRNHSRFSGWIYRVRQTWERVIESISNNQGKGSFALVPFLKWYWPKFNATAFVLSRENEYEADACAKEFAGRAATASALTKVGVLSAFIDEKFWPDIFARVNDEAEPPRNAFNTCATALAAPLPDEESSKWMQTSFLIDTNNSDTHPCLRDRLAALGCLPEGIADGVYPPVPLPPETTAAASLLGANLNAFIERLNQDWLTGVAPVWKARHEEAGKILEKLQEIPEDDDSELTEEQLWKKARLMLDLKGDDGGLPVLNALLAKNPEHAPANFIKGRQMLSSDDAGGLDWIERSMKIDESLVGEGLNVLYGYYARNGMRDKLRDLERRYDAYEELMEAAQKERAKVTAKDAFLPHELSESESEPLRALFAEHRDIGSVHIARKDVKLMPGSPLYVICVDIKVAMWKVRSSSSKQKIVEALLAGIQLEGQFLVFVREGEMKSLGKKIKTVPDSLVYQRQG